MPSEPASVRQFHGLFIGINRYRSKSVRRLASAARDAKALHAVFSDNLGDANTTLLIDREATRDAVVAALVELQTRSTPEDVVVISFSGHGSTTHELVTHDADPDNLPSTSLPLEQFTDLVSAIPARQLIVVLDCCFAGGAGAKVLNAPLLPRGGLYGLPESTDARLERLAGSGRLVLAAATGEQEAWEDPHLGHGLLTFHLLRALLGAAAEGGQVRLYDLLAFVTREVRAKASGTVAAEQDPSLRGQMDGELQWPVFTDTGPRYSAQFPSSALAPVTPDLTSLHGHGIPQLVMDVWAARIDNLNDLQVDTINQGRLLAGANVLVMAPTSSGKTMIGELAAIRAAHLGGRSVFLLPTRALVNEQYARFSSTYGPTGLQTIRATGETADDVPALLQGQFDLAVLTYEKFAGLALGNTHLLKLLSVIVIDEVQTIVDPSRGAYLEFLLTLLKARRPEGVAPQVVALSAVLGDLGGLDSWLDTNVIIRTERPVPLLEGVLGSDGIYRYIDAGGDEASEQLIAQIGWMRRSQDLIIPLVRKLVGAGQQVIIFRSTRGLARGCARYLAGSLGLPQAKTALDGLAGADPTAVLADLRQCLAGGVAFHISDLARDEKLAIEDQFRAEDSGIRVLVSTTTLAQGVNLPAETVIIVELDHPTGPPTQTAPYSVAEYKNIAGRAGRLGLTDGGRAISIVGGGIDGDRRWRNYVLGKPEDLRSQLLDPEQDVATLVLRVVAVASRREGATGLREADVVAFLSISFAAHQQRLAGAPHPFPAATVSAALDDLVGAGLLSSDLSGIELTELGTYVSQSGLRVSSAVRVARTLRDVNPTALNRVTIIAAAQLTDEAASARPPVNGKGWQKEQATYLGELQRHGIAGPVLAALPGRERKTAAERAKRAVACMMWMAGVPVGRIEQQLMVHMPSKDAAGATRASADRTQSLVGTIIDIARCLHPDARLDDLARILPVQLEFGIPPELVPLARHTGAALDRTDYLRLASRSLTDLAAIDDSDDDVLLACLNGNSSKLQVLRQAARTAHESDDIADLLPISTD